MTAPVDGGRFRSRGSTYGAALGLVLALLAGGVAVPVLFGERPQDDALSALPGQADADAGLADLDGDGAPDPAPGASGSAAAGPTGAGVAAAGPDAGGASPGSSTGTGLAGAPGTGPAGGRPAAPKGGTVKLGIVLTNIGALAAAGFSGTEQYDTDRQKVFWEAYIARANAAGGAAGKKIVPAYATVDIVGAQSSAQAACKQLTETEKVFAVVHLLGIYGAPILCFTRDHRTPYLAVDGAVSSFYAASGGYLFTVQPSTLRTHLDSAARLRATGELGDPAKGTGKAIGVLSEDGYLQADNDALQRYLERAGYEVTRGTHSSTSSQNVPAQLSVAASNMCAAGVEVVFLNTNALFGAQFVNDVESRPGCRPAYVTSDFDFQMSGDSFLQQMPDGFYRRAIGVTASRVGEGRSGAAEPAYDAGCRRTYESVSGERLDRNATGSFTYFQAMWNCTLIDLFAKGLTAAGPDASRAQFAAALGRIGTFDNAGFGRSAFTGTRTDAPSVVRRVQAFRDCTCWKALDAFVPSAF